MSPVKKWTLITLAAIGFQAALMVGMLLGMQH